MKFRAILLALFALFAITPFATAHQVDSVELEFVQSTGKWKLEGLLDIAYMLPESRGVQGAPPLFRKDVMDAPLAVHQRVVTQAEITLRKLLTLEYKGKAIPWKIRFPDFEKEPLELPPEEGGWALMRVEITADALPGPGKLTASWHDDQQSELIVIVEEGEEIGLFPISAGMTEVLLTLDADKNAPPPVTPNRSTQAENWMISGYLHVVPTGLDHILFILGLFLLAPRWKPLMGQSLTFTLAHSVTLALCVLGVIVLPQKVVNILIAASIAWIGIENLLMRELKPSRLFLVFAFGLLHGIGFASGLKEKLGDLSGKHLALPLVGFNIGVELAQISVLITAFLLLWPIRKWTPQVRIYGSVFIALAGIFWMIERIFA